MSSLAAVQADGYYHPPDYDPRKGSLNKYHNSHGALGDRARKLDQGILVVRFEMPFRVWCQGCNHLIDTGVRFNAEKKQVGMYHSTKIWSFSMKSPCCKKLIEIQTDPRNSQYVVVSGARRKIEGNDDEDLGRYTVDPTASERPTDAIGRLEIAEEDKRKANDELTRIQLLHEQNNVWYDNDAANNRKLRHAMRATRKEESARDERRKELGLHESITLMPETKKDILLASAVDFRGGHKYTHAWKHERKRIKTSSIFSGHAMAAAARSVQDKSGTVKKVVPKNRSRLHGNKGAGVQQHSELSSFSLQQKSRRLNANLKLKLSDPKPTNK